MLLPNLNKYHIILASKSPRRRELLQMLRIPFTTVTMSDISEEYPEEMPPEEVPQYLSEVKADAYLRKSCDNELVITADTLVICDNRIMGKPKDVEEAIQMLLFLSDKTHHVVTGVTIATKNQRTSFTTVTEVKFATVTEEEARFYVDNFRPLDKAGAYGIQEWIGAIAVEYINGSFYNVMGLPVHRLYKELKLF